MLDLYRALLVVLMIGSSVLAQSEATTAWKYYLEVPVPEVQPGQLADFVLPPELFGRARRDLYDLRLYSQEGKEVPYALRIRERQNVQQPLSGRMFNIVTGPDGLAEARLDLGATPQEYNLLSIHVEGNNFRRSVQIDGSDNNQDWRLLANGVLLRYSVESGNIDARRVSFPATRFRYLRVRVSPDRNLSDDKARILELSSSRTIQDPGEDITLPARLLAREPLPIGGEPGSTWRIDFGAASVPVRQLSFDVTDPDFFRRYLIRRVDSAGRATEQVASGEWRRLAGEPIKPRVVDLSTSGDINSDQLQLAVIDNRNPPLTITSVRYTAAVRQVVFDPRSSGPGPLRLYFGNPQAYTKPSYDFAANLPANLRPAPVRAQPGSTIDNPDWIPPPAPSVPITERQPWLVYVVLAVMCLVLAGILGLLARSAMARYDALQLAQPTAAESGSEEKKSPGQA